MDTKKLLGLREKGEVPELVFDPKNVGGAVSAYGLVKMDGAFSTTGVNINYDLPYEHREDGLDIMAARAEYVAMACNAIPQLIEERAALLEACVYARVAMVDLGNDLNWEDVPQSYADAINAVRAAIALAEAENENK